MQSKIIAVDFDGTIVSHMYPEIGVDNPNAIRVLKKLIEQGHQLILWTMRSGPELAEAVKIIAVSPPFGAGPVVVGKSVNLAQRESLRKNLLTMHEDPRGKAALAGLMIDKYIPANLDYYEPKRGTGFARIKP